jgi:hypothetical protein
MNELAQSHRRMSFLLKTGQVTQYSSELDDGYYQKGIAKSYTILTTGQHSGNAIIQLIHLDVNTGVSFDAASKEIRCAGAMGVFKSGGGETIIVSGSSSNNGTFTTATGSTADHVHVTGTLTDEAAGQPVVIKKQEVITNGNNCVIDNNTGLMWQRYLTTKMGTAGNGRLPWTGQPFDIFAYCAAANTAAIGGYSDWRVPNVYELASIFDCEAATPLPDSTAFPVYSTSENVHTSTTVPSDISFDFTVSTASGNIAGIAKTVVKQVQLVRG